MQTAWVLIIRRLHRSSSHMQLRQFFLSPFIKTRVILIALLFFVTPTFAFLNPGLQTPFSIETLESGFSLVKFNTSLYVQTDYIPPLDCRNSASNGFFRSAACQATL